MIDVQIGEGIPAAHHEIDEPFERLLFIGAGEGPRVLVGHLAVLVCEQIAEEIFEAMLADKRAAF